MKSAIQMMPEDFERRFREYQSDQFIIACQNKINKILSLATPFMEIDLSGAKEPHIEIDKKSKEHVDWWLARIKEYVENNYSDLLKREL